MKALTLTQPWASLMALQHKAIETRSWRTDYRGPLVIHSAKGFPRWAQEACDEEEFAAALGGMKAADLPLSQGLCVVELLGCVKTTELHKAEFILGYKPSVKEISFGDYDDGRYAWITRYVRPLEAAHQIKGALGLWEWSGSLDRVKG